MSGVKLYGIKVSPIQEIEIAGLKRHPMNILRTEEDREASRILTADIKEQGVQNPILVTLDGLVLQGWRRVQRAQRLGIETVPGRQVEANLPRDTIARLIFRDNALRENYTDQDIDRIIRAIFTESQVLDSSRGGKTPLERVGEELTGIPAGTIKYALAAWRRELAEGRPGRLELSPEEMNYARNRLKDLDKAEKEYAKLEEARRKIRADILRLQTEVTKVIPKKARIKGREARIAAVRKAVKRGA